MELKKIWRYGSIILMLSILAFFPGCKKNEDTVSGNWKGTLTVDFVHQHEEYQEWIEEVVNPDGTVREIEHIEHITWSISDSVVIEFQFDLQPPLYNAHIDGEGSGHQFLVYSSPTQCNLISISAPDFDVSVLGTVDSTSFNFRIVPKTTPKINLNQQCPNVQVIPPVYGSLLLGIISNINVDVPSQSGITFGGSGVTNIGTGINPISYIYNLTLTQS